MSWMPGRPTSSSDCATRAWISVVGHRVPELLAQAVGDVLADGERVEEGGALEEVGDAAADLGVARRRRCA